jgi:hypothetical protein
MDTSMATTTKLRVVSWHHAPRQCRSGTRYPYIRRTTADLLKVCLSEDLLSVRLTRLNQLVVALSKRNMLFSVGSAAAWLFLMGNCQIASSGNCNDRIPISKIYLIKGSLNLGSGLLSRCCKAVWRPIVTCLSEVCQWKYQLNISGGARRTQTGHFQS